jgi:hypothetical protein
MNIGLGIGWSVTYIFRAIIILFAYTVLLPLTLAATAMGGEPWYGFARDFWRDGDGAC